jgi:uncharacterized protein YegL
MGGESIERAKEALILFIKSLPIDSYFNVISFGSDYAFMESKSTKFSKESVEKAIGLISKFDADMGGTEILSALKKVYSSHLIADYPTNIFLLTDGEVSDPDEVISLVNSKKNATTRVYTLGIGDGCSRYLVEKTAILGNGLFEFVSDDENISEKVIFLLQDSITPYLEKFQMNVSRTDGLMAIVPDPETLVCIRKN